VLLAGQTSLSQEHAADVDAPIAHHAQLRVQTGISSINSVAISPDGRRVLIGSEDKTARLWDVASGKELQRFVGHTNEVTSVAFSPDGRTILTGGKDKTARLWDVESGRELRRFPHSDFVPAVAFSPNGRTILTGCLDKIARLWDVATGKELQRFVGHTAGVTAVAFSADGRRILTGSSEEDDQQAAAPDNTARLWDAATGKQLQLFAGHSGWVRSVAISPDGHTVLTGSSDKTARLWDADTGKELQRFEGHLHGVESVAFSPDGRTVLTGGDLTARLWDPATGKELHRFLGERALVNSVAFSRDGRTILTGGGYGTSQLWDVASGKPGMTFAGHSAVVNSVGFTPDGRGILTGNGELETITDTWNLETGKETARFAPHFYEQARIKGECFSPDRHRLVTTDWDYKDTTARLWDVDTGKELQRFTGHTAAISTIDFSQDGGSVLTGADDHTVRVWDAATGKQLQLFDLGSNSYRIDSAYFSPDGRRVTTFSQDSIVRIWDVESGKELLHLDGKSSGLVFRAFTPDGRRLLGSNGVKTALLDVATGNELWHFNEQPGVFEEIQSIAFSPDGRRLLTARYDNTAWLWDAETGRILQRFTGHTDRVTSAIFSPDGRKVFTGSFDGTSRLWDAATGNELASLASFTTGGWAVVDPAGRYDASDADNSDSMYWVTDNLRTIDLGQLKNAYYTPGLLARVIKEQRLPDVTGMDTVTLPPILAAAGDYNPATHKLVVSITDDSGGVGRLLVKVNDRLLQTIDHPPSPAANHSVTLPIDLSDAPFVPGDNTIRIAAYDAANRIQSQQAIVHYQLAAAAKGVVLEPDKTTALSAGRFFAVVVGTSTFSFGDPRMNLTFPAKDAESIATGLRLGAERLYGKDNVWMRVLTSNAKSEDGLPTKNNIRAAFDEVRRQARPEDTLVVYLSGHGAMSAHNRDLYYYLTADARTLDVDSDPALRDLTMVSSAELFEWLREPVKTMPLKQVVILDTCAAGAAGDELAKLSEKRAVPPDQQRAIELLKDGTGTFILMGSAADAVSYEASKYGEGLLTYALLQGMRGASLDDGSRLGVSRWFQNAIEQVPSLAKSIGGIQKPLLAAPRGAGFPVALLTPEDRAQIPLALPMPQLLRVVCEDENQDDPLHLRNALREQMRALNYAQSGDAQTRGATGSPFEYLDTTDDDLPGALSPRLRYQVSGDKITVRIRLISDEKTVAEGTVNGSTADTQSLARMLADRIVAMAVEKR
jgi:WD40 repeat protein